MALVLNNNYAGLSSLAGSFTENQTTGTVLVALRTGSSIPAGSPGIHVLYSATTNQYFGFRFSAGNIEAGLRTGSGTPAVLVTGAAINTLYVMSVKKTAAGSISARVNSAAAITKTVTAASTGYNRLGIGIYNNGGPITGAIGEIAYARVYSTSLSDAELDKWHAGDLAGMSTTGLIYSYDLVSDLNSEIGGTALTFTDPESDPVSFNAYDPFAPAQSVVSVNSGAGITAGSSGNTAIVDGFLTDPTVATHGGFSMNSISYNAGTETLTFSCPAYADGQTRPPFDGLATFSVTAGAQTGTLSNVPTNPPAGWANTVISSPIISPGYLGNYTDISNHEVVLDQKIGQSVISPSDGIVLSADGAIELPADLSGLHIMFKRNLTTGVVTQLNVTISEIGEIISVERGLTAVGLSSKGITASGLVAVGL